MIRGSVKWSLQYRILVLVLAAALMVVGVIRLRAMPADVLPEFAPPYVEIQTESLGLSAEEVEQLITVPMEQDLLNGVPWVDTIRSDSVPGLSSVVIVFKPGTDLMQARQMVAERMTQAVALPHVSKPPTMLQPLSATGRVMIVGLSSKSISPIQMGVLARWTIAPRLMGVPGVASVAVWGQQDRQLQVLMDPKRMQAQDAALLDVLETTGNALWVSSLSFVEASTPGTGGFIDGPNQRLGIFHLSPIVTAEGLAQIPISDNVKKDGTPLRLGDVANVVEDHQPLIGNAVVNGGSGLLLVIEKFPGSNTLEVTRGLEAALADLQPGLPDVAIDTTLYRPATFVEAGLRNLALAMILGGVLLALVLGAFYWNWRLVLISSLAILFSLGAGGLVLTLQGATLNAMILAGLLIAVGVIVDNAIGDVTHIVRRLQQQRQVGDNTPVTTIMLETLGEMRGAGLFAAMITLLAIVPVFFIQGVPGAFFQPLAVSYALAVLASVVTALVITPGLSVLLLASAKVEDCETPLVRRLQSAYEARLKRLVGQPRGAWFTLIAAAVIGLGGMYFFKPSLVPDFKERDLLISLNGAPGTSQAEMSRIATLMSGELHATPGVRDVGALIGRAVLGDQVVNVNSTELWVSIDPAANYNQTVAAITAVANGYPGFQTTVQTYLKEASRDVVPQPKNSVTVRLYGDTDPILLSQSQAIQQAVTGVKGVTKVHIDLPVQQLTLETEVNIAEAQRYGLKPGDVRRAAATLLSGIQVGSLFEEQKIFDVVVWSTPETRHSLTDVGNLLIDTPDGHRVRLGDVADVRIVPASTDIRHEAVKRYRDVIADVQGRDLAAVAADIQARLRQMQFPMEYHALVLGDYATTQAAQQRLFGSALAVLIAIFFILQAVFGSWRLAAVGLLALPAALAGGVLAALAGGPLISIGAVAGLLAVFGMAARHSLLLVNHYQHLQRHEGETPGVGLILRGARERLASVLMTTLATGLAFVPALIMGDVPGLEIMRPMAVVMLGGLVTSTLLNLFILPTIYLNMRVAPAPEIELAMPATHADMPGGPAEAPRLGASQ